jgi:hypothetical protein
MSGYDLKDYIDARTRIEMFYKQYPTGSLQFEYLGVLDVNPDYFYGVARAYRTPDDTRPATGYAQEAINGKTSFTRGSELMNLETSAISRAVGMLGIGISVAVATLQEVVASAERAEQQQTPPARAKGRSVEPVGYSDTCTPAQAKLIRTLLKGNIVAIDAYKAENGITGPFTKRQASEYIEQLKEAAPLIDTSPKVDTYDPWATEQTGN